ncbi:MAG: hypothetical protein HYZ14_03870 [Bacteroidetes bacterium]|nr:hypothetical protein [Bacteroidota bacterium]
MNPFLDRYKNLDLIELLRILDRQEDYEPLAIQAVKIELDSRNVSLEELNEAKMILANEKLLKEKSAERKKEIRSAIINSINPIQSAHPSLSRSIIIISIAFTILSVYLIYTDLPFLMFLLEDEYMEWDLFSVFYFLPILIVPVATVLFWRRKKSGWTILFVYLIFSLVNTIGVVSLSFIIESSYYGGTIPKFLFFIGSIIAILKKDILGIYVVDKRYLYKTGISTLIASVILVIFWINGLLIS